MAKDEDKKKKKKARALLLLFLKRLRTKCGSFENTSEWYSFLKNHLDPLIEEYQNYLPSEKLKAFENAHKLTQTTREGLHTACHALQTDVEDIINTLPKGSPLAKLLLLGVVATSGIVAAALIYINMQTVEIVVKNQGCQSLTPVVSLPIEIPGFQMFRESIPDGGVGTIRLLPIPITVDATANGSLSISLLGAAFPFNYQNALGAQDIVFNGSSLLGKKTAINLGSLQTHTVTIVCR